MTETVQGDFTRESSEFAALVAVVARELGDFRVLAAAGYEHIARGFAPARDVATFDDPVELFDELRRSARPCVVIPHWETRGKAILQVQESVNPFGIILPAGELSDLLPRRIERAGVPRIVVEARAGLPEIERRFRVALVLLEPAGTQTPVVTKFFQAPVAGGYSLGELVEDCERLMQQHGGTTRFGFVFRGSSLAGQSLRPADHDPRIKASAADLADFGAGALLGDVFDVLQGHLAPRGMAAAEADCGIRVIGGRDVTLDGELLPADNSALDDRSRQVFVDVPLREGDLVMRQMETPQRVGVPVKINASSLPLTAGSGLWVLRPKDRLDPEELEFYRLYLGTRRSRDVMRARSAPRLELSRLREMPLPRPDAELLTALRDIRRAQESLKAWASEGVGLTSAAFTRPAAEARRQLIESGRQLRQRAEAADQVGSRDHRIANFYPYPVAHKWRLARVAEGTGDDAATYAAILDCFEATMTFGAALALVFAHTNGIDVPAMREVRRKLATNGHGVSLGDWINILKAVASGKAFKNLDPDKPLASIRGLLPEGTPIAKAQERLSRRRNDESHQRRVEPIDLPAAIEAARADLELIMDHAGFLADLPIFQITSTRWDSLERRGEARATALRGDHPIAPSAQLPLTESDIETGSLYVRDLSGALILLRPFLVRHECPQCRTWSTFSPDRRDDGVLLLKAVDHSHTIGGTQHEQALRMVGYLE